VLLPPLAPKASAADPTAVLLLPALFFWSAENPTAVLPPVVVLL